ncbi:MAG TPA: prepilin peptidase [Clostridiales bacterium]|nr:prepilin peptidase [Clostridiales bacterium]
MECKTISLKSIEVFILIFIALISDIKTYKIKNNLILVFIIIGIITNCILAGKIGLMNSLLGIIIPVAILFSLFAASMLGAGDIKVFSAIGSIMGIRFAIHTIIYSFLWGGVISLAIIVIRKNRKQRLKYLYDYLKSCILTLSIVPYTNFDEKNEGDKFQFAYAIVLGTVLQVIFNYSGFDLFL